MFEMNLANLHRAKGRYKEAEPLYAHLVETQARVQGEEHVDTLNTMGNFANLLQETGRYEKAEALHRRELEIRRRVQGEKAPGTLSTLNNLANDLALLGRYDEAVPMMQRALELKIDLYGLRTRPRSTALTVSPGSQMAWDDTRRLNRWNERRSTDACARSVRRICEPSSHRPNWLPSGRIWDASGTPNGSRPQLRSRAQRASASATWSR